MKKTIIILLAILVSIGITACNDTTTQKVIDSRENSIETDTDTEDIANDLNYEIISEFMEEECRTVFSPYYELLDFEIYDYEEQSVNGSVEAIYSYKVVYKNYDRDPDTVKYIKEAKERGSINYKLLYDEYLEQREMNFHLKAIIDENKVVVLYSNISPKGIEWEETNMSDYIIRK